MPKGVKEELTPAEIAERDLLWLQYEAGQVITQQLEIDERRIVEILRGIARTCNKTALFYEKKLGLERPATRQGRKPRDVSSSQG